MIEKPLRSLQTLNLWTPALVVAWVIVALLPNYLFPARRVEMVCFTLLPVLGSGIMGSLMGRPRFGLACGATGMASLWLMMIYNQS
jgi:hypothetical protein